MSSITPFLWFNNNAQEAAEFYKTIFPNTKITPNPMGAEIEILGQKLTLFNGGPMYTFNEAFSLMIPCKDQAEIDTYWARLTADGGQESQCGWLKDKFGVSWQIVPENLGELLSKPGAMQAMLKMKKLDIAILQSTNG